jgi:hypothetical protein
MSGELRLNLSKNFRIFVPMEEIIDKWKINKSVLATRMGMTNTTFNKKLSVCHTNSFSDTELVQLKMILREMNSDLESIIDIDFNDALKLMLKK